MTTDLDVRAIPLQPFGLLVRSNRAGVPVDSLPATMLREWTDRHLVLVLRGFAPLAGGDLEGYCRTWGELLTWDFGAVFDLAFEENPRNYLFDSKDVPFHWDGAFATATPRYFVFQCLYAPTGAGGGETVFCDTTAALRSLSPADQAEFAGTAFRYRTEKLAHYGGDVEYPLVSPHPRTGELRLRYAEPLASEHYRNPLTVELVAGPDGRHSTARVTERLASLLRESGYRYEHEWQSGDLMFVDNERLLHGRNAFRGEPSRRLQRVQIL
ncbi:MAG: TauD/TfdA dioxygenase family protein [Frankia sp.]